MTCSIQALRAIRGGRAVVVLAADCLAIWTNGNRLVERAVEELVVDRAWQVAEVAGRLVCRLERDRDELEELATEVYISDFDQAIDHAIATACEIVSRPFDGKNGQERVRSPYSLALKISECFSDHSRDRR